MLIWCMLLLEVWDDRYVSTRQYNDMQNGKMPLGKGRCSNIEGPGRSKVEVCNRGQLGGRDKEAGGEPGPPDKTREFIAIGGQSSIRRGPSWTKKAKGKRARMGRVWTEPLGHRSTGTRSPRTVTPNPFSSAASPPPCLPADSPLGPPRPRSGWESRQCVWWDTSHPPLGLPPSRPSHRIIGLGLRGPSSKSVCFGGPERNQMKKKKKKEWTLDQKSGLRGAWRVGKPWFRWKGSIERGSIKMDIVPILFPNLLPFFTPFYSRVFLVCSHCPSLCHWTFRNSVAGRYRLDSKIGVGSLPREAR